MCLQGILWNICTRKRNQIAQNGEKKKTHTYALLTNTRQIVKYSTIHAETQWTKRQAEPNPAWIYAEVMLQLKGVLVNSLSGKQKKKNFP